VSRDREPEQGGQPRAHRRSRRVRLLRFLAATLAVVCVALWPGGPFRPRAESLRGLVPPDAQLVVRLDPHACLDHPFVAQIVGREGRGEIVEMVLAATGRDAQVAADDALAATDFVSELVVFIDDDDEAHVIARLTPLVHALAIVDRVWSPPDDVAISRYRDVVIFSPDTGLASLDSEPDKSPAAERPFDAALAWSKPAGTTIRMWARASDLLSLVSDDDVTEVLGLASTWLSPHGIETLAVALTLDDASLDDEFGGLKLRLDVRPHDAPQPLADDGPLADHGTRAARLRAARLAAPDETLWHAGLAGSVDTVLRAVLGEGVRLPTDLDRLAERIRAVTLPGVAVAVVRAPAGEESDETGCLPGRFVAAARLRPEIDSQRVAAIVAERLEAALRRDVDTELTAGGRTIIRVTGPSGPALVIGRGELILFEERSPEEPLIAAETWSDETADAELAAEASIDFAVIGRHESERAPRDARAAIEADVRARRHGETILADLEAAKRGLTGEDARKYRRRRLEEIATRAAEEGVPAETDRLRAAAARRARLGRGTVSVRTDATGHVIEVVVTPDDALPR